MKTTIEISGFSMIGNDFQKGHHFVILNIDR